LYRSFTHYFTARGLSPADPEFPLVAIVLPDSKQFFSYARSQGARVAAGTLGYYSSRTNRILLYDVTGGRDVGSDQWHVNAETIIHEAAHQAAFNSDIHSRYAETPRWLVEGLGTMFEAPGVWNNRAFPLLRHRIHQQQLDTFRDLLARQRRNWTLKEFVSSDRLFSTSAQSAYAESWALSFYLAETQPREYWQLLQRTAHRPAFEAYTPVQRIADVQRVLGADLDLVEARWLRYVRDLP
jgi:hypothetical protein